VMLFGESGGGFKTGTLMAMPAAHGLFHKAGMQSGPMLRAQSKETASETTRRVLAGLGIAPQDASKLAEVPAEKLLAMQLEGLTGKGPLSQPTPAWRAAHATPPHGLAALHAEYPGNWAPVVDGVVLPQNPFDPAAPAMSADIPLLIGNNRDEATFFERDNPEFFHADAAALTAIAKTFFGDEADRILAVYRQARPQATPPEIAIAIETAMRFGNATATLADRKAAQPAPVYRYRYDFESNTPIKGTDWTFRAGHASDIAMVFTNYEFKDLQGQAPGMAAASKAMSSYFTSFARSAVPAAADQPAWPRYNSEKRPVMLLNSECRVVDDPDSEERKLWQSLGMID
jgi:para-nitrobenzyl esterase